MEVSTGVHGSFYGSKITSMKTDLLQNRFTTIEASMEVVRIIFASMEIAMKSW